ncbi:C2 calcium/lipid-binding domain, CaLB, partial [Cynara cardunculus var. scolymus]
IPGQRYCPSTETCRNFCRNKVSFDRSDSFRIFNSFIENSFIEPDKEVKISEQEAQTDQKTCLDCCFNKTVQVTGDVCVTFYEKNIGGRLFYACFNTAFIENSSLQ